MRERLLAVGGGSLLPFRFLSRSASPTEKKFLLARGFCCAEAAQGAQPPCEGARLVWNKVETKFRPYRASYSSAVVVRMCVCVQCVEVNTCPSHRSPALRHPTPHPAHSHHRTHSFTSRGLLIDYTPATTHAHPPRTHTPAHTHTRSQPPARTGPVVESTAIGAKSNVVTPGRSSRVPSAPLRQISVEHSSPAQCSRQKEHREHSIV